MSIQKIEQLVNVEFICDECGYTDILSTNDEYICDHCTHKNCYTDNKIELRVEAQIKEKITKALEKAILANPDINNNILEKTFMDGVRMSLLIVAKEFDLTDKWGELVLKHFSNNKEVD